MSWLNLVGRTIVNILRPTEANPGEDEWLAQHREWQDRQCREDTLGYGPNWSDQGSHDPWGAGESQAGGNPGSGSSNE